MKHKIAMVKTTKTVFVFNSNLYTANAPFNFQDVFRTDTCMHSTSRKCSTAAQTKKWNWTTWKILHPSKKSYSVSLLFFFDENTRITNRERSQPQGIIRNEVTLTTLEHMPILEELKKKITSKSWPNWDALREHTRRNLLVEFQLAVPTATNW